MSGRLYHRQYLFRKLKQNSESAGANLEPICVSLNDCEEPFRLCQDEGNRKQYDRNYDVGEDIDPECYEDRGSTRARVT